MKELPKVTISNDWADWPVFSPVPSCQRTLEREAVRLIPFARMAGYGYGTRREDQTAVIDSSGVFGPVVHLDSRVVHEQTIAECVEAWRSHATLERQAGSAFRAVVQAIEDYLKYLGKASIQIPYSTNIWVAQLR